MPDAKQSGIGIGSFVTSPDAFLFIFLLLILATAISEMEAQVNAVETCRYVFIWLAHRKLSLGIEGLFQLEKRKSSLFWDYIRYSDLACDAGNYCTRYSSPLKIAPTIPNYAVPD